MTRSFAGLPGGKIPFLVLITSLIFFSIYYYYYYNSGIINPSPPLLTVFDHYDPMIFQERLEINEEMMNFPYSELRIRDSVVEPTLKDLILEQGGQPIRALVTTTWRSGSTFIGDILNSHPAVYYHYEPLLHFGIRQVRDNDTQLSTKALKVLTSLFHCDYSDLSDYIDYGRDHLNLFTHNERLWKRCIDPSRTVKNICFNSTFLSRYCSLFPFQSSKTVRLRVNLTRHLLDDPTLAIKVLVLIRDPRGTLQSRKHRDWCPGQPDCDRPDRLCHDLEQDYYSSRKMIRDYPGRFEVYRYEDVSLNPRSYAIRMLRFFGLHFHPKVDEFLQSHTQFNRGDYSSTFRDSKTTPFQWRFKLKFSEVQTIQDECHEAMKLWGYKEVEKENDLKTFTPLMPFKWE